MKKTLALLASVLVASCSAVTPPTLERPSVYSAQDASQLEGVLNVAGTIQPGAPAALTLGVVDRRTGQAVTRFQQDDTKYMHLVVVSADLETFAHVHPVLQPDGRFAITLNAPNSDFDNQMAVHAMPKPGTYFLFADVTPMGGSAQLVRYAAATAGSAAATPLALDPRVGDTIQKYFTPDGLPGRAGDAYRVTLGIGEMSSHMPMVNLSCHIEALQPNGQYAGVTDLQSWLGMPGHAILVSQSGQSVGDKVFLHLHAGMDGPMQPMGMAPMKPITGPDLKFMAMGQEMPPPGVYKMWVQTERSGQVLTFPFVFQL